MRCPFCAHEDSQVKDSRPSEDGAAIRRRRQCEACGARFTTFERVQLRDLTVVKKDGKREPFDRAKLEAVTRAAAASSGQRPQILESADCDRFMKAIEAVTAKLHPLAAKQIALRLAPGRDPDVPGRNRRVHSESRSAAARGRSRRATSRRRARDRPPP